MLPWTPPSHRHDDRRVYPPTGGMGHHAFCEKACEGFANLAATMSNHAMPIARRVIRGSTADWPDGGVDAENHVLSHSRVALRRRTGPLGGAGRHAAPRRALARPLRRGADEREGLCPPHRAQSGSRSATLSADRIWRSAECCDRRRLPRTRPVHRATAPAQRAAVQRTSPAQHNKRAHFFEPNCHARPVVRHPAQVLCDSPRQRSTLRCDPARRIGCAPRPSHPGLRPSPPASI